MTTAKTKKPPRHYISTIEVSLTEKEIAASASKLAAKAQELGTVEAKKASASAEFGAQIKTIRGDMKTLAGEVATKRGDRALEVYDRADVESGVVEVVRADTGEVVRTMEMSAGEKMAARQSSLDIEIAEGQVATDEPSTTADGGRPGQKLTKQKRNGTLPEEMDDRVGHSRPRSRR